MTYDFGAIPALIASDQAGSSLDPTGFDPGEGEFQIDPSDFLAWARTMPADRVYDYMSNDACAVCHFLHHTGVAFKNVGGASWYDREVRMRPIPNAVRSAVNPGWDGFSTFGALVSRLESEGVQ